MDGSEELTDSWTASAEGVRKTAGKGARGDIRTEEKGQGTVVERGSTRPHPMEEVGKEEVG